MRVPRGTSRYECIIKRSRFIGQAWAVPDRREVDRIVTDLRREHRDVNHVVYAFVIGDTTSQLFGLSDDGEPRGTAGRPILDILKGSDITDCLVTVVRYFGGTKLGTGGLVHAYGDAARGCLDMLTTEPKRDLRAASVTCPYPLLTVVRTILLDLRAEITTEAFNETVTVAFLLERGLEGRLNAALKDVSRGTLSPCFT
ncbi:MAG: YigZ family protein [Spirochaetales bacterium]|nr:YigZ family protein [Spirochaetales bacterium]